MDPTNIKIKDLYAIYVSFFCRKPTKLPVGGNKLSDRNMYSKHD
jgi:hypothetical protein